MKLHIKNQLSGKIEFRIGSKEYELDPDQEITIEANDEDCMYFDHYDWQKDSIRFQENGNCPICFGGDCAEGHHDGCYIDELGVQKDAAFEFINELIRCFEETPLSEDGTHRLIVDKATLEKAKKALVNAGCC
ncbi:hypothetical protein [Desulfocucumis palustris]|uniref:hypothetical protein n=1 Tax=Desulfocucumis palustris TaxID=1898651 RepID=UPI000FFF477B|nr:hypothetical protein [Desulfocucumis palustris]